MNASILATARMAAAIQTTYTNSVCRCDEQEKNPRKQSERASARCSESEREPNNVMNNNHASHTEESIRMKFAPDSVAVRSAGAKKQGIVFVLLKLPANDETCAEGTLIDVTRNYDSRSIMLSTNFGKIRIRKLFPSEKTETKRPQGFLMNDLPVRRSGAVLDARESLEMRVLASECNQGSVFPL